MPIKLRGKIKIRFLFLAILFTGSTLMLPVKASNEECPDLKIIFARGSGAEQDGDQNYIDFKDRLSTKLATTNLTYEFIDLDYPAVGIGIDKLGVTIGAYFGGGDSYEFGESVDAGVRNLIKMVGDNKCTNTKYVIGGYSQGAMVISKALPYLNADKILYAATFGDPKIYLPEGEGINPAACRGENLSDYRAYVPDCQAYKGLLGAYVPYEPEDFLGKLGTWCNKEDIFCSSYLNINDHTSYVSDNLYEDATRVIFSKIIEYFGLDNQVLSPHDTVFLFDSSGSMSDIIDKSRQEALRLATKTLESGGRIALFDYRDLADPYEPVKHCDFTDCTLEKFESELMAIELDGGGDAPESLLSAAKYAMLNVNWQKGATKSILVATDAGFLSPDRDGTTVEEVVELSKTIDPVNIYVITKGTEVAYYRNLTRATGGIAASISSSLTDFFDYIMSRYDSLPRVEERSAGEFPGLVINNFETNTSGEVRINFGTTGTRTLVILNDSILGVTEDSNITIDGLKSGVQNRVTLVPLSEQRRGEAQNIIVEINEGYGQVDGVIIPKAPNTGKR